jgi:glycosyltransferase involved in cell wall biosynthesis
VSFAASDSAAATSSPVRYNQDRVSAWLSDLDLQEHLRASGHTSNDPSFANLEADLRYRLERFDWPEIEAVRGKASNLLRALALYRQQAESAVRAMLLRNFAFGRGDEELMEAVVRDGLSGEPKGAHRWLLDYDIVSQRERLVRDVVLPFAEGRGWTLFANLKRLEIRWLLSARPASSQELHRAVMTHCDGTRTENASTYPAGAPAHGRRLELPDHRVRALLYLARATPEFVSELAARSSPDGFLQDCAELASLVPTYLVLTRLAYPMGGGESYLHQTCRLLTEFGVRCVWTSFRDAAAGDHPHDSVVDTPYYLDMRCPGGVSVERIAEAIEHHHPDLMHTQGEMNEQVIALADERRITTLVGQHFWSGLVQLGPSGNTNILGRIREHRVFPSLLPKTAPGLVTRYVASEFMEEVYRRVGGTESLKVLHPLSDPAHFMVVGERDPRYALCLNVSLHKGGGIFLDCVRALGERIAFMGVAAEPGDTAFLAKLHAECANCPNCVLHGYGNVQDWYSVARLVMVPTLVDETFCRVAYEAAMNGIPVLSTHNGYLPWLLGETGVFLSEESRDWIEALDALFEDTERLTAIGRAQRAFVHAKFSNNVGAFVELAMSMLDGAASRNIGFFSVWGDQGLGNLIHHYARLIRQMCYRVHIFSFQPYAASGRALTAQCDPDEWAVPEHADSVYYSFNDREQVPAGELRQFVLVNRIRRLLVPEVCWTVNWQRLFDLRCPVSPSWEYP